MLNSDACNVFTQTDSTESSLFHVKVSNHCFLIELSVFFKHALPEEACYSLVVKFTEHVLLISSGDDNL